MCYFHFLFTISNATYEQSAQYFNLRVNCELCSHFLRNHIVLSSQNPILAFYEKGLADEDITKCGREFKKGEYYVKGRYLHLVRSRGKRDRQQFAIGVKKNDDEVAFPPDEIHETFIDIDANLTMNKEELRLSVHVRKLWSDQMLCLLLY